MKPIPRSRRSASWDLHPLSAIFFLLLIVCALGGCATHKEVTSGGSNATPAAELSSTETEDFEKTALTGPRGGTLRLTGAGAGAKTFNPLISKETSSGAVWGVLFDGLVRRDQQTLAMKPALAKSWDTSQDGRTW